MTEPKRYRLETMTDLAKAYRETENKEGLMKDLTAYISIHAFAADLSDAVGEEAAHVGPMTWIDDGKNDANINLTIKDR